MPPSKNPSSIKKAEKQPKPLWEKRTASVSRWLHIYLSMVSFVIILFFAVTGLTLNHADWFGGKEVKKKLIGQVPLKWVKVKDTAAIAKFEIVQLLKTKHSIKGEVSDFIIDDDQCLLSFKGPGYSADAFVDRTTGDYKVTETSLGIIAVMNDLHKGRDTGKKWAYLIDVAAVFMTLLSLTGLVMICFMKKKRLNGFMVLGMGTVICYLIYYFLVP
ncbi:MAG: PepSY-associated TM helix domain-containing protein [Mucilaginibacter sp.]|nr:PepSY-associated TM helix domain-containing protein [Mucilaginibacter sp.]